MTFSIAEGAISLEEELKINNYTHVVRRGRVIEIYNDVDILRKMAENKSMLMKIAVKIIGNRILIFKNCLI